MASRERGLRVVPPDGDAEGSLPFILRFFSLAALPCGLCSATKTPLPALFLLISSPFSLCADPLLSNNVLRDSLTRLARRCGVVARAPSLPSLPSVPSPPSFRSRPLPTFTKLKKGMIQHAFIFRRAAQRVRLCRRVSLGILPEFLSRVPARVCRNYSDPARILAVTVESDAYACGEGNSPAGWRGARSDSANCVRLYGILSQFTPALSSLRRSKERRALARSLPLFPCSCIASLPSHSTT
ncbi:hypothetical protein B0H13DRAFT_2669132 [Mycena leptocephala]|nr:hypothetical protein B0H13DRAFT_2669132 [Mycena leptocephala]